MASLAVIRQNADMNTLAVARLSTLENARRATGRAFISEQPEHPDESADGDNGQPNTVPVRGSDGINQQSASPEHLDLPGWDLVDAVSSKDDAIGGGASAGPASARTLADLLGGAGGARSDLPTARDEGSAQLSRTEHRRVGVSYTRHRQRCTFTMGHAVIVMVLLVAALCASLTLLLQQSGNYAAFQRQTLALENVAQTSGSLGETDPNAVSAPHEEKEASAEAENRSDGNDAADTQAQADDQGPESSDRSSPEALIDLNTAGAAELMTISGIGPVTAERIVAFRRERGRFNAVDKLLDISGIGIKKLEGIRPYVRVG
jgi:competence protein ComEA